MIFRLKGVPLASQLLNTKIFIPPARPEIVSRPRLLERLSENEYSKLTLISAPAGFGKTTLLSEWIANKNLHARIAWVSLDKGDNDPVLFWSYVISAVQSVDPDLGVDVLATLQSPQPPPIDSLLTDLINEIAVASRPVILIFDDFHLITAQINEQVALLLDNLPPHVHLVISSRADPPWTLAQLRARGEILELRAEDLRFTQQEVSSFLNETMDLGLSVENISALDTRTEGWIAGLRLAAISMRGRDASAFINAFSGSHRFVLDYLVEEVLDRQTEEVREFLLRTSILDRLTPTLCDAVTKNGNGQLVLRSLDRANLFLMPLDDERRWYRYHHLFSELLLTQLTLTHPDLVSKLHQRASEWFEERDFTEETISHAFAAKDYDRAARLVEKYARGMLYQSKYNVLSGWIEALPDELVQKRPWLCVYQSWTRHWAGLREEGEKYLENAESSLNEYVTLDPLGEDMNDAQRSSPDDLQLLPGYIATVRAHYAVVNEKISRAAEEAEKALQLLPKDEYFTRGTAAVALGAAYWAEGDVTGAEKAFAESAANALKGGYRYRASSALVYKGMQQVKQARLLDAKESFQESLRLSLGTDGRRFPNAGYPLAKLGELACEWNDLEEADNHVSDGVVLSNQLGHVDLMAEAYVALARVQLAQGEFTDVRNTIKQIEALMQKTSLDPWIGCWLDDCRIRLWISTERLDNARRWIETSDLKATDQFNYHHDLEHINLARVLVARDLQEPSNPDFGDCLGLLERLLKAAKSAGWIHEAIKILILMSLALHTDGDEKKAVDELNRALDYAKPGGYVRTFVSEGAVMAHLLRQVKASGSQAGYVRMLLTVFEGKGVETRIIALVEPLSDREKDVLRLLASQLSVPEIADELFISVHTVRSHVKSIYGKLSVHSRLAAIQRAKELDLI